MKLKIYALKEKVHKWIKLELKAHLGCENKS